MGVSSATPSKRPLASILPREVWQETLEYLSFADQQNFKQVSKQGLEWSRDIPLTIDCHERALSCFSRSTFEEKKALRSWLQTQNIQELRFTPPVAHTPLSTAATELWSSLAPASMRVHTYAIAQVERLSLEVFKQTLAKYQNLKKLIVTKSKIDAAEYLGAAAAEVPELTSLMLHNCQLSNLVRGLSVWPNLTSLSLYFSDIRDQELRELSEMLSALKDLTIAYAKQLTTIGCISKLVNLITLSLDTVRLTDADLLALSTGLVNLQSLDMDNCGPISDAAPLGNFKELKKLGLYWEPSLDLRTLVKLSKLTELKLYFIRLLGMSIEEFMSLRSEVKVKSLSCTSA